jgi:hypothetical protein
MGSSGSRRASAAFGRREFGRAVLCSVAALLGLPADVRAGGDVESRGPAGGRRGGDRAGRDRQWSTWGDVATPAGLTLTLEPAGEGSPATAVAAVLRNDGPDPVTLAVDPRLADVDLRAGRTRVRCPSPDPISPPDLRGAPTETLAPGGSVVVPLDLLYHCWDRLERVRRAADGGTATLGVTYGLVLLDPELGEPIGRAGTLTASAELPLPGEEEAGEGSEAAGDEEPLGLDAQREDAPDGSDVWLQVTLRNRLGDAVKLVDHPTQFRFRVTGPTGSWDCAMEAWNITPLADLLVRVRRGGKYEKRLDLGLYCPAEAFARAGVYWVEPAYDPYLAGRASEPVLDRAVQGTPVPVRVRRGGG